MKQSIKDKIKKIECIFHNKVENKEPTNFTLLFIDSKKEKVLDVTSKSLTRLFTDPSKKSKLKGVIKQLIKNCNISQNLNIDKTFFITETYYLKLDVDEQKEDIEELRKKYSKSLSLEPNHKEGIFSVLESKDFVNFRMREILYNTDTNGKEVGEIIEEVSEYISREKDLDKFNELTKNNNLSGFF